MSVVSDFLGWWTRELCSVFPGSSRDGARRWDAMVVRLEPDAVVIGMVSHRRLDHLAEVGRVPGSASNSAPMRGAIAGLVRKHYRPASNKVEVWLDKDRALSRVVQLPLVAEENLRAVLGFEMERLTPFKAADVYYEGRIVGRSAQAKQLDVQLHVVPSRAVDEVLGLLPSGLTSFDRNRVEIREFKDGLAVGFLPPERAERVSPAFNTFLVLVNLGLFAALVAIPLVEQRNALEDLSFNMRSARSAAAQANSVQARIDELHVGVERLMEAKSKRPASVQILDEIARRLPDSTWIHRLELKGDSLQVSGSSDAASSLIEVLEDSEMLAGARFLSPVTQEPRSGRERFHISARVVRPSIGPVPAAGEPANRPNAGTGSTSASSVPGDTGGAADVTTRG